MLRKGSIALAAIAICAAGCALEPPTVGAPGQPRVSPALGVHGAPPAARVVLRVPRSPDEAGGLKLVQGYVPLRRRESDSGPFRPFLWSEKKGGERGEAVFYDLNAVPGEQYRYVVWALAAQEHKTFGTAGGHPRGSTISGAVRASQPVAARGADAPVQPARSVRAVNPSLANGRNVDLFFRPSSDDAGGRVAGYAVMRAEGDGAFHPFLQDPSANPYAAGAEVDRAGLRKNALALPPGGPFRFQVWSVPKEGDAVPSAPSQLIAPAGQFWNPQKINVAIVLLLTIVLTFAFLRIAISGGDKIFIRRIAGVDAIEEAVGRATEMGRPILYVPGIDEIQNIQTIASVLILGRVAELVARYDSEIKVPCCIPLVATIGEEVVRQGFYDAGRPDAHRPQNVQWISSEQFAFCAGTNGIMLRDKPATNIFLGRFFAESLILAETGYVNRAIQIAGTAEITQLPFFIAACDYTLLGEELFAVSAYMSRDPRLLSTLKAADWVKAACIALLTIGGLAAFFAVESDFTKVLLRFLETSD